MSPYQPEPPLARRIPSTPVTVTGYLPAGGPVQFTGDLQHTERVKEDDYTRPWDEWDGYLRTVAIVLTFTGGRTLTLDARRPWRVTQIDIMKDTP